MKILPEPVAFQWDEGNSNKNYFKHKVTNRECEEIFIDKNLLLFEDSKHSKIEERYGALGKTNEGRLLFIFFTLRGDKVRIISARDTSRKEEKQYEEA